MRFVTYRSIRWLGFGLAVLLSACQETAVGFGSNPIEARTKASELFTALAERFTNVERTPALAASALKITRAALAPSHIYDDSTIWTSSSDGHRTLTIAGTFTNNRYAFVPRPTVPETFPHLADGRDEMVLTKLAPGTYEWTTHVRTAIGSVTGPDVARAIDATLATAAVHTGPELRGNMRAAFPRTAAAFGKLYSLDSIAITPASNNTAVVHLAIGIHPDSLSRTLPAFGAYLTKYLGRSRIALTLTDRGQVTWATALLDHDRFTLTIHATRDGHLAPFTGPPRPLPDSLLLKSDLHTRAWIFGIGASNLVASVTTIGRPHEAGWVCQWQQEPDWHFPPLVEHFLKDPLRRPFVDEGMVFRLAIRDSANAQSILTRDARVAVQESAIATWLGGLGGHALAALSGQTAQQMNHYFAEIFSAFAADVNAR